MESLRIKSMIIANCESLQTIVNRQTWDLFQPFFHWHATFITCPLLRHAKMIFHRHKKCERFMQSNRHEIDVEQAIELHPVLLLTAKVCQQDPQISWSGEAHARVTHHQSSKLLSFSNYVYNRAVSWCCKTALTTDISVYSYIYVYVCNVWARNIGTQDAAATTMQLMFQVLPVNRFKCILRNRPNLSYSAAICVPQYFIRWCMINCGRLLSVCFEFKW